MCFVFTDIANMFAAKYKGNTLWLFRIKIVTRIKVPISYFIGTLVVHPVLFSLGFLFPILKKIEVDLNV